jgi:hypothetical protein
MVSTLRGKSHAADTGPEILGEFMALFDRVTENMASVCTEEDTSGVLMLL